MSNPSLHKFSSDPDSQRPEDFQVFMNGLYDLIEAHKKETINLVEKNFSVLKESIKQMIQTKENQEISDNTALNDLLDKITTKLSIHTSDFRVSILTKRYLTKEIEEVFMKNLNKITVEYATHFLNKVCQCYDIRWLLNQILSYAYLLPNKFVFNQSHVRLYKSIDGSRDSTSLLTNIVNKSYTCMTYFDGIFSDFLENQNEEIFNTLLTLINKKWVPLNVDHGKKLVNKIVKNGYLKQNYFLKFLLESVRNKLFELETNTNLEELFKIIIYKENIKNIIMFLELYHHELNYLELPKLIKLIIEREEQVGYDLGFFKSVFYQFCCPLFIGLCKEYNEHYLSFNNSLLLQDKTLVTIPQSIVMTLKTPSSILPPRYKDMCQVLNLCPQAKIPIDDFLSFLKSSEREDGDTNLIKIYENRLTAEEMELVKPFMNMN